MPQLRRRNVLWEDLPPPRGFSTPMLSQCFPGKSAPIVEAFPFLPRKRKRSASLESRKNLLIFPTCSLHSQASWRVTRTSPSQLIPTIRTRKKAAHHIGGVVTLHGFSLLCFSFFPCYVFADKMPVEKRDSIISEKKISPNGQGLYFPLRPPSETVFFSLRTTS